MQGREVSVAERIGEAVDALRSADTEPRILAVETLAEAIRELVDHVVASFVESDDDVRYLVFERMGRFGSLIVAPLERTLDTATDPYARGLAAVALMELGSDAGLPVLLDAVTRPNMSTPLAIRTLGKFRVHSAGPMLRDALLACDMTDANRVRSLVVALRELGIDLPPAARSRIMAVEPAWLRDSLLD